MLGFDKIELIQELFENRGDLVKSFNANQKMMRSEIATIAMLKQESEQMPSYGRQVMVQSEEEMRLKKQVRKEEKRMHRLIKNVQDESDEEEFDPKEMLLKRQTALATAMTKPLLKPKEKSPAQAVIERYPYVFDSYAEAKLSAGFIQVRNKIFGTFRLLNYYLGVSTLKFLASNGSLGSLGAIILRISSIIKICDFEFKS